MILKSVSTGVCPIVRACRIETFVLASLGHGMATGDQTRIGERRCIQRLPLMRTLLIIHHLIIHQVGIGAAVVIAGAAWRRTFAVLVLALGFLAWGHGSALAVSAGCTAANAHAYDFSDFPLITNTSADIGSYTTASFAVGDKVTFVIDGAGNGSVQNQVGSGLAGNGATTYTVTGTNDTIFKIFYDVNPGGYIGITVRCVAGGPTATQSISSEALTVNVAATSFTPVTGSGGAAPLTYSISPSLPTGLSINSSTGAITGTPTATSAATNYTVTVTDASNATSTAQFSLTVNGAVTATQAVSSKMLTVNAAVTAFTPVTGSGGTGPLTYSVSPSLPTGLSINSTTGAITGTPTATSAATNYTVTVTDANGATNTAQFSLTVNGAVTATQTVSSKMLTVNAAVTAFTPVTGSGGTAPLTYSVSPSLPTGLSINPSTGAITGTPIATSAATNYTVTVTDANGAINTAQFGLTVNGAVTATQAVSSKMLTVNAAVTAFTPVTASGGTGPLTYSVSPSLPTGLSINSTTGAITGTPTAASAATNYTVTVTDANGATNTAQFSLTVNGAVTATQAVSSKMLTVNAAVTAFTPVTGSGGTAPLTYSVSPSLPTGLSINSTTGAITGTPTATKAATNYTVTVTDANGAINTAQFSLTVNGTVIATQAVSSKKLTVNAAVTAFTPVTGSGGTAPLTYSVSPSLPTGLSINPSTGAITGTPTATSAATNYTVTVTDANNVTNTASFSLSIVAVSTTSLTSSPNPSALGQSATFTARVTGSSPTGTVTFYDGMTVIGTCNLSAGSCSFTISSLSKGSHSITASYAGDGNNAASTSSALMQSVGPPADSVRLRQMQIIVTQQSAQISGQAITGAIDNAIEDAFVCFSGACDLQAFKPNGSGFTYNFAADEPADTRTSSANDGVKNFVAGPDRKTQSLIDDEFSALAYAGNGAKAPPKKISLDREWLGWIDVRGIDVRNYTVGADLKGTQVNVTAGLTRKVTSDVVIGAIAGYEHLDFNSDALNSRLKGDGWTVGGYLGWRIAQSLRFDMALARTGVSYNDASGTATAAFPGDRWLASGGLTGTYRWQSLVFQPSARIYALWEHDSAYTDSLGTAQGTSDFTTARTSFGGQLSYPFAWSSAVALSPYAGAYADYYFSSNNAAVAGVATPSLPLQGWSARLTTGLAMRFMNGGTITAGSELGGIGSNSNATMWTYRLRGSVPF